MLPMGWAHALSICQWVTEQAADAALQLGAPAELCDHLLEEHLDDTRAWIGDGLFVVVPESSLVGISSDDANLIAHDCLVENLQGIMDPTHLGRNV